MLQNSSHTKFDKIRYKKGFKHCTDNKAVTHINKEENSQFPSSRYLRNGYYKENTPRNVHTALHCMQCFRLFSTIRSG
jgi:hypothetical protein